MRTFKIDYFGEKTVGYYGTFEGAKKYAESFSRNLLLTYKGSIKIYCGGWLVAEQEWVTEKDDIGEYTYPKEWVRR